MTLLGRADLDAWVNQPCECSKPTCLECVDREDDQRHYGSDLERLWAVLPDIRAASITLTELHTCELLSRLARKKLAEAVDALERWAGVLEDELA